MKYCSKLISAAIAALLALTILSLAAGLPAVKKLRKQETE